MTAIDNDVFVFLTGQKILRGLFDSHVIHFLKTLYENNIILCPNVLLSIIVKDTYTNAEKMIFNGKIALLNTIARNNNFILDFYFVRGRRLHSLFRSSKEIGNKIQHFNRKVIWAHNYFNGYLGYLITKNISNCYLHLDLKGAAAHEELYYSHSNIIFRLFKFLVLINMLRISIRRSNSISVVSKRFASYLRQNFKLNHDRIIIYPSVYDSEVFFFDENLRTEYLKRYGIQKHQRLILYSGGLQKWQIPDNIFRLFKNLQNEDHDNMIRFMVVTLDKEEASYFAEKYKIQNLIIESASGRDLVGIYNAADIGIASRTDDLVSQVSSPTKIAEYLITRNAVVLTKNIGDYGIELQQKRFAIVKDNSKEIPTIKLAEVMNLEKQNDEDLKHIEAQYSNKMNIEKYKRHLSRWIKF